MRASTHQARGRGTLRMLSEPPSITADIHNHVIRHNAPVAHLRGRSGLRAQLWGRLVRESCDHVIGLAWTPRGEPCMYGMCNLPCKCNPSGNDGCTYQR